MHDGIPIAREAHDLRTTRCIKLVSVLGIFANSEEEIRSRIIDNGYREYVVNMKADNYYESCVRFDKIQGEIHIKEVNLDVSEPYIVCSSYNAG